MHILFWRTVRTVKKDENQLEIQYCYPQVNNCQQVLDRKSCIYFGYKCLQVHCEQIIKQFGTSQNHRSAEL